MLVGRTLPVTADSLSSQTRFLDQTPTTKSRRAQGGQVESKWKRPPYSKGLVESLESKATLLSNRTLGPISASLGGAVTCLVPSQLHTAATTTFPLLLLSSPLSPFHSRQRRPDRSELSWCTLLLVVTVSHASKSGCAFLALRLTDNSYRNLARQGLFLLHQPYLPYLNSYSLSLLPPPPLLHHLLTQSTSRLHQDPQSRP